MGIAVGILIENIAFASLESANKTPSNTNLLTIAWDREQNLTKVRVTGEKSKYLLWSYMWCGFIFSISVLLVLVERKLAGTSMHLLIGAYYMSRLFDSVY